MKFDAYFREKLGPLEQNPPNGTWDRINDKLHKRRRQQKVFLILKIAAGMALLVSSGLGYYQLSRKKSKIVDFFSAGFLTAIFFINTFFIKGAAICHRQV